MYGYIYLSKSSKRNHMTNANNEQNCVQMGKIQME